MSIYTPEAIIAMGQTMELSILNLQAVHTASSAVYSELAPIGMDEGGMLAALNSSKRGMEHDLRDTENNLFMQQGATDVQATGLGLIAQDTAAIASF